MLSKNKIVIFGGSGFIGSSLAWHLKEKNFEPVIISRSRPVNNPGYHYALWDGRNIGEWKNELEGALAVVNLAGKSVDCIKTPDNCDLILRSRLDSCKAIGEALKLVKDAPVVWIQMSTAHIYGDPPVQVCSESSTFGYGLAPFVGKAWEKAFLENLPANCREVRLRTGFVIGRNGGALSSLKRIAKMGLGGKTGSGRQGFSWIHEYDMNEIILQAVVNEQFKGAYIASAPNPVSNAEFMRCLRKTLGIPFGLPAPSFMVKLGAKYIFRTDPNLALFGRYVNSERLNETGFVFKYPELMPALTDLLKT